MTLFFAAILAATAEGRDTTGAFMFTFWVLFCGLMIGMMIEMCSSFRVENRGTRAHRLDQDAVPGTMAVCCIFMGYRIHAGKIASEGVSAFLRAHAGGVSADQSWMGPVPETQDSARAARRSDQIAGFRQFLQKVEQDPRLNRRLSGSTGGVSRRFAEARRAAAVRHCPGRRRKRSVGRPAGAGVFRHHGFYRTIGGESAEQNFKSQI